MQVGLCYRCFLKQEFYSTLDISQPRCILKVPAKNDPAIESPTGRAGGNNLSHFTQGVL